MNVWCDVDRNIVEKYGGIYNSEISEKVKTMTIEQSSEFFIKMLSLDKTSDEMAAEVAETVFYQYSEEISLKREAADIIEFLSENKIPFCLATSTHRILAEVILKKYHLYDKFEFILTGEDVPKSKKFPDIYIECTKRLGKSPSETLVVEDSLHCVETTVKAGFPTAAVYDSFSHDDMPEIKALADYYIYNLGELKNIIKE